MDKGPKWKRILEGVVIFIAIPLLFFWEVIPLPKIPVLLAITAYCGLQLWRDPSFGKGLLARPGTGDISRTILLRSMGVAGLVALLVWLRNPDQLFAFPTQRPFLWMVVMVLYPILSALPQEFIFRTYFFHRYSDLFSPVKATLLASALAFAFLHIVYDNWWAIGLGFAGGLLFGSTYNRTQSLFWVTVEHAIYGCLVFTLGLGHYFYEPF